MSITNMDNLNVKIDAEDKKIFNECTKRLGTTPSNAVRMFVRAFNEHKGFPFDTSRPYEISAEVQASYRATIEGLEDGTTERYESVADLRADLNL